MNQWDKQFRIQISKIAAGYDTASFAPGLLHIGGHIGQEAGLYLENGILATYCEPVPDYAQEIRRQGIAHRVLNVAVGNPGIKTLYVNNQESSIKGMKQGKKDWDTIDVVCVPLALLQKDHTFNILVIDAQGATMDILISGKPQSFDWVICEASKVPTYPDEAPREEVEQFMKQMGFKHVGTIQHGEKDIYDLIFKH